MNSDQTPIIGAEEPIAVIGESTTMNGAGGRDSPPLDPDPTVVVPVLPPRLRSLSLSGSRETVAPVVSKYGSVKDEPDFPLQRTGDVISPHRAILTLCKSMFNAGCFSLPYAWKLGGLWVSFAGQFIISALNWYGNHILVRCAQHMASVSRKTALDYGHFAKKVLDNSPSRICQRSSKAFMYFVNVAITFYQIGMCSVAILFIGTNLSTIVSKLTGYNMPIRLAATAAMLPIIGTNMVAELRFLSIFALFSTLFFLFGTSVILGYCFTLPNVWYELPGSTNFFDTIMFFGIAMYAYEGQTMVLPVENKLEHPTEFLDNCGVLPATMSLCTALMTAIGFYGYTAFGNSIAPTITQNIPESPLFLSANVFLMLQSMLGHCLALYVVLNMYWNGFRRKVSNRFPIFVTYEKSLDLAYRMFWIFITYFLAVAVPGLDVLVPLVGVSSGTLCALVFPTMLETICFWQVWRDTLHPARRALKLSINAFVFLFGVTAVFVGIYTNTVQIVKYYSG